MISAQNVTVDVLWEQYGDMIPSSNVRCRWAFMMKVESLYFEKNTCRRCARTGMDLYRCKLLPVSHSILTGNYVLAITLPPIEVQRKKYTMWETDC